MIESDEGSFYIPSDNGNPAGPDPIGKHSFYTRGHVATVTHYYGKLFATLMNQYDEVIASIYVASEPVKTFGTFAIDGTERFDFKCDRQ